MKIGAIFLNCKSCSLKVSMITDLDNPYKHEFYCRECRPELEGARGAHTYGGKKCSDAELRKTVDILGAILDDDE